MKKTKDEIQHEAKVQDAILHDFDVKQENDILTFILPGCTDHEQDNNKQQQETEEEPEDSTMQNIVGSKL